METNYQETIRKAVNVLYHNQLSSIKKKIKDVVLTGSVARKTATGESDIDLLFILKERITDQETWSLFEIINDFNLTQDHILDIHFALENEIKTQFNETYKQNLKKFGISLLKNKTPKV